MTQDVEVIIRLKYNNQSSTTADNEPSMQRVRRDLYDMLLNQTLHYEERRTNSLQDYVEELHEQLDEVIFDTDYSEFLEWASKTEFMKESSDKNDAQQLINRRHEDTSSEDTPSHSHEYHRFPGTKKTDYSVKYEVDDEPIEKKENFDKRVEEARESFKRWSDENIDTVKEEESKLVDTSPYRHIMPVPKDETQLEFDFKTE